LWSNLLKILTFVGIIGSAKQTEPYKNSYILLNNTLIEHLKTNNTHPFLAIDKLNHIFLTFTFVLEIITN